MKPVGGTKIPRSAKLHHRMNVKKSIFNSYIYTSFLNHFVYFFGNDLV